MANYRYLAVAPLAAAVCFSFSAAAPAQKAPAKPAPPKKAPVKTPPKPVVKPAPAPSGPAPYTLFTRAPFEPIDADTKPGVLEVLPATAPRLSLMAAADEMESVPLGVLAKSNLKNVTVKMAGPLVNSSVKGSTMVASAVDVRVVRPVGNSLVLMKDDRESLAGAAPVVRLTGDPLTDVSSSQTKQFWVTVKVPRTQIGGTYNGTLVLSAPGVRPTNIAVSVQVHGFPLKSAFLQYGLDFRTRLSPNGMPLGGGVVVTPEALTAQFENIRDHGFRIVTLFDDASVIGETLKRYGAAKMTYTNTGPVVIGTPLLDKDAVRQFEQARTEAGLPRDFEMYYWMPQTALATPQTAASYAKNIRDVSFKAKTVAPVSEVIDYTNYKEYVNVPVFTTTSQYAQRLIVTGKREIAPDRDWWTWNPALERQPIRNRLLTGFQLYKTGLKSSPLYGAFAGPYQQVPEGLEPLGANAGTELGAYALAYPVAGGVLDTLQWEAAREGIDDIRYIGALRDFARQIKDAESIKNDPSVKLQIQEAEVFLESSMRKPLESLPPAEYQRIRAGVAQRTQKLVDIMKKAKLYPPR